MKYIAWKHDENCEDRWLYAYSTKDNGDIGTTSFREKARVFDVYPKNVEEKGFTIQEVFE